MPRVCVCVRVCRSSIETDERIELPLAWELPSTYPIRFVVKKNSGTSKNKVSLLPSGTLFQTPDLKNFATVYRSSKYIINLARKKVDSQSVTNWTVVVYLRAPTLDRCIGLVYHR